MPLPTSGAISFGNIRTEMAAGAGGGYTGAMPINDATFRAKLTDTAQNASLSLSSLRGNAFQRFFLTTTTSDYVIRNALIATGWNGTSKGSANVYINGSVVVGGTGVTTPQIALSTGTPWPAPSTIDIYNNGFVVGRGGSGGAGGGASGSVPAPAAVSGNSGQAGGTGLYLQKAASMFSSGTVAGGGGGGGGGGGRVSGAAPLRKAGGGGGGGGRSSGTPAPAGAGGTASGPGTLAPGGAGVAGSFSVAGGGGSGGTATPGTISGGGGGTGGAWGAAGSAGSPATGAAAAGPGGSAGIAVAGFSLLTRAPTIVLTGPVSG